MTSGDGIRYEDLADEELVSLFDRGDRAASDCLLERYKGYVRSLSRARFLIGGETDDLIQEGMIGLVKAIRDYDPEKGASFKTFATLCIVRQHNTAIEASARQKNEPLNRSVSLTDDEWENAFRLMKTGSSTPEEILLEREASKELEEKIRKLLSPFENQVLSLYLDEVGYREIAKRLGKTPKTIDNAIQRIRKKVRAMA